MPSREVIKKPFIDLIKTIRKYRLLEFGTSGVTSIPKSEITELVLKDNVIKLFKGEVLNKFDEADIEELKKLGYNRTDEVLNKYYIEHTYNNTDYYIFSTTTKEKIDECLNKITQGEEEIKQGKKYNKLVFEEKINGKWYLKYKGKKMWVRENDKAKSIALNICLLMFKYPAAYINKDGESRTNIFSEYPNYKIGDEIQASVLTEIILIREEEANRNKLPKNDKVRQIRDAIIGINNRSRKKLGVDIFAYSDQKVQVIER